MRKKEDKEEVVPICLDAARLKIGQIIYNKENGQIPIESYEYEPD